MRSTGEELEGDNGGEALQRKDPLVEVIKEVFSVIKLAKIVKKTFATTSIYGYGGFGGAFNRNSTQLKKLGGRRLLQMFFFIGTLIRFQHTGVCHLDSGPGAVEGSCTGLSRYKTTPGVLLVLQRTTPYQLVLGFVRCP